jgi:hypothetical protein
VPKDAAQGIGNRPFRPSHEANHRRDGALRGCLRGACLTASREGCRLRDAVKVCSASCRRGGELGLGCQPFALDGAVNGGATNAEQFGDLKGAVLAAVHERHEMRFLSTTKDATLRSWPLPHGFRHRS